MKLPLLFALALLAGGCSPPEYTRLQEEQAYKIVMGRPFIERGKNTPAEFAANRRGKLNHEAAILRGECDGDYAEAVRKLSACYAEAELGFTWTEPRRRITVPKLPDAPEIDGNIMPAEWRNACRFTGEYLLNQKEKLVNEPSQWYIGEHDNYLYLAAYFRDSDLCVYDAVDGVEPKMYEGDVFEFFLRPRPDQLIYYEFIVNPNGKSWNLMHLNDPWGDFFTLSFQLQINVRAMANQTMTGFSVELAVPLTEFHGKWCTHPAKRGDRFDFMMIRTNRNGNAYWKSSPVPFLYDGHNIFGYIEARLE